MIDAAFDSLYKSVDQQARKAAWFDIEKRVLDQAYMIKVDRYRLAARLQHAGSQGLKPYFYHPLLEYLAEVSALASCSAAT